MGERGMYCAWLFVSSPMGAMSGWHYETQCGHNITVKQPKECPYCGKPIADDYTVDRGTANGD